RTSSPAVSLQGASSDARAARRNSRESKITRHARRFAMEGAVGPVNASLLVIRRAYGSALLGVLGGGQPPSRLCPWRTYGELRRIILRGPKLFQPLGASRVRVIDWAVWRRESSFERGTS